VKTHGKRTCEVCGTAFNENSEFCPVCALRGALETQSDSVALTSSELRFEHYTVLQNAEGKPFELGRGAMGVTYKAFDVHLQRPAALKIINAQLLGNESARARFVREARAAASVRHQNVASVFHIGESGGNYYYAMEFVEGESLAALIRRSGCLETHLALGIVKEAAAGLVAIEKQHLVHRDIKPSNIMVSLQGGKLENVELIDLGLAKGVAEENTLSTVGAFVGTPAYASPEQFAGIATDIRSDLYSLGVTLWEMLSGKLPFSGSAAELMYQHQHAEPPIEKLKNVPLPVVALLQVLVAKDPGERFQSPGELQRALTRVREAIASGLHLTARELTSPAEPVAARLPKVTPKKQPIRWVVGSFLCVAALATAWFFFSGRAASLFNELANTSIPPEKSIAVLPFENISPNKDDAYFADGVQGEILNNLAKIAQLKVISRTSVMQYRSDTKRDLRQIASALGVANVLEGTVRRDGNHVRVSTELVDARNDNTIWADSYDRDLTDIFAIQSEVAKTVAGKLTATLSSTEKKRIEAKPTKNLEAYDLYLRAKELIPRESSSLVVAEPATFSKGLAFLEEATRMDPNFALGYCLIAKVHDFLYDDQFDHTPERRALGDAAVDKALQLQPDLPEVHLAVAFHLYTCYRDFERARVQLAIAAQSLSNSPDLLELMAIIDQVQGRWEEATTGLEKAVNLDPRNPELLEELGVLYGNLRRYRDADRIWDRVIELEPDQQIFQAHKAWTAFLEKGDVKRVRAAYEALPSSMKDDVWITGDRIYFAACDRDFKTAHEVVSKSPNKELYFRAALVPRRCLDIWLEMVQGNHPTMEEFGATREQLSRKVEADPTNAPLLSALACVDIGLGRKEEAISEGKRAIEMLPISKDATIGPKLVQNLALVYAWADEPDLAFDQLNILMKGPTNSLLRYGVYKREPNWDPLRKDPRFDKLLAELAPRD